MQKNPISWWEISSKNAAVLAEFFKQAFDWRIEYDEKIGYYEVLAGKADNGFYGGGFYNVDEGEEPYLIVYISVDETLNLAQKCLFTAIFLCYRW